MGYYHIVGEVKNVGDCTASYAEIIATLYDSEDKVIGTSFTFTKLETLAKAKHRLLRLSYLVDCLRR